MGKQPRAARLSDTIYVMRLERNQSCAFSIRLFGRVENQRGSLGNEGLNRLVRSAIDHDI